MSDLFENYSSELISNSPFFVLRIAQIVRVYADEGTFGELDSAVKFLKVDVRFLDYGGDTSLWAGPEKVQLSYLHISNGYGFQFVPAVGDRVVVGFRIGRLPVILGFISDQHYDLILRQDQREGYLRSIVEGEYCLKSKEGAEWYLDRKGSLHLIVRDQASRTREYEDRLLNRRLTRVADVVLAEVVLGKRYSSDFKTEIRSSRDRSLRVSVLDRRRGTQILIDEDGNVELRTEGDVDVRCRDALVNARNVEVRSSRVDIGDRPSERAVLGDSLKTYLDGHIHPTPTGPSSPPVAPLPVGALSTIARLK